MTEPTRSIPDIAEELMYEFESLIAVSTVTEVVIRLSRAGQATLSALTDLAREELCALAAEIPPPTGNLAEAVSPGSRLQPEGA